MPVTRAIATPQMSPRFGRTLRIDPINSRSTVCRFSCVYCAAAQRETRPPEGWTAPDTIVDAARSALAADPAIEAIVFSGNGEPTEHPGFAPIFEGVLEARREHTPRARIVVVSNGSSLNRVEVQYALARADVRLMKLDAGDATTFRLLSGGYLSLGRLLGQLRDLGNVTLLSRFVRDAAETVDNTTRSAVDAWLGCVERVNPIGVQISGSDWRSYRQLTDVPRRDLERIAERVTALGIPAAIF